MISDQARSLKVKDEALATKDEALKDQEKALSIKDEALKGKEAKIEELEQEISERVSIPLATKVDEMDKIISDLQLKLTAKE